MKFLKKHKRKVINLVIIFLILTSSINKNLLAQTEIFIGVEKNYSKQQKPSIAFINFISISLEISSQTLKDMKEIIRADILFSDYLNVVDIEEKVDENIFIEKFKKVYPFFVSISLDKKSEIIIAKANIYNTIKRIKLTKEYSFLENQMRRAFHMISDDIIENTVEKKGIASSRIVFSNDSTGFKEIYMIDYDGENLTKITDNRNISIIPKWSNDGKKIYYTTYKYGNPDIAVVDLENMKTRIFSRFQGLNVSGGFSPDGTQFVVILSRGKDPSIYILDLVTREVKNILENFGVCAAPTFSPDGKEIAFVSDRAGNPQLYIYNLETNKTRKITNFYWVDSPSWSPDGTKIAFSARQTRNEKLNIYLTDPTTSVIERITRNEGDNEDPTFSPDSRYIAFISTRNGSRQLFIMDRDGSRPHLLTNKIKGNCYTPNWSKN